MNYRTLGRTGLKVSEIGMGCEGLIDKSFGQVKEFVDRMEALGINCIDLYSPNPEMRSSLGRAIAGRRDKFILQSHLCSIWENGQYLHTRDIGAAPARALSLLGAHPGKHEAGRPGIRAVRKNRRLSRALF